MERMCPPRLTELAPARRHTRARQDTNSRRGNHAARTQVAPRGMAKMKSTVVFLPHGTRSSRPPRTRAKRNWRTRCLRPLPLRHRRGGHWHDGLVSHPLRFHDAFPPSSPLKGMRVRACIVPPRIAIARAVEACTVEAGTAEARTVEACTAEARTFAMGTPRWRILSIGVLRWQFWVGLELPPNLDGPQASSPPPSGQLRRTRPSPKGRSGCPP